MKELKTLKGKNMLDLCEDNEDFNKGYKKIINNKFKNYEDD